ncbi:hypothetical protein EDB19DRAFT_1916938 [Suillus lakei]|nr:hypothetical protein EDB19DRAFT_1916938 [Suillus lakei]
MSIDSVELISQEVNVIFFEDELIRGPEALVPRVEPEAGERHPTTSKSLFPTEKTSRSIGRMPASKIAAAFEPPSLKSSAQFSAECSIYSTKVTVSAKSTLERGLESATNEKPPKDSYLKWFFKDEHDKQTQEEVSNSGFGSVFRGPQGLCPGLEAEHPARIFIGQSTSQTTGMACHMSGYFTPTVERGSIDLANGHVSKWNEELLYVGGFARIAYDCEMNKVRDAWPTWQKTDAEPLAMYVMKSFIFHPSTPDPKMSRIIKDAFFACSTTDKFPFIFDQGIRHTKDIRPYNHDLAAFMRTPVFPAKLHPIFTSMTLLEHLRVGPYTFKDVLKELDSRWLSESEMAACLRWWSTLFESHGPLDEQQRKQRKAGRTHSRGREVRLSSISKFIDGRILSFRHPDDPLPHDTIPPALIQSLNPSSISEFPGWQEMSIIHWLLHLRDNPPHPAHDIARSEVREFLKDIACIPTTITNTRPPLGFPHGAGVALMGVQKRCDIEAFIAKAMCGDRWDAMDLARYLITATQEYVTHVMDMKLLPYDDGERRHISELFASAEINRAPRLPVINCDYWDSNTQEALFRASRPSVEEAVTFVACEDHWTEQ